MRTYKIITQALVIVVVILVIVLDISYRKHDQEIQELRQLVTRQANYDKEIADLTEASKATWYELEQHRIAIDHIDAKTRPDKMINSIFKHLRGEDK